MLFDKNFVDGLVKACRHSENFKQQGLFTMKMKKILSKQKNKTSRDARLR